MKKGVVYTCLVDSYDEITNPSYVSDDFDYVCFTDKVPENPEASAWEFRPLAYSELDPVRNNRWHKLHPHVLFPEYDESIYIDANIDIIGEGFFQDIREAREKGLPLSLGPHFARKNIFDEFDACESLGKDDVDVMRAQEALIRESGFSGSFGTFFENNIIYRRHNDEKVKKIMEEWWWWIENHSRRDQLSLTYVLWKNNFHVEPLSAVSYRENDSVRFLQNRNHITKEELLTKNDVLTKEIEEKSCALSEMRENLISAQNDLKKAEEHLHQAEQELSFMKSSKFWKLRERYLQVGKLLLRDVPRLFRKAVYALREGGIPMFMTRLRYFRDTSDNSKKAFGTYDDLAKKEQQSAIAKARQNVSALPAHPKVSILVPVYDVDSKWLDRCVESVLGQVYGNWELCLYDDASTNKATRECLVKWEGKDERIKVRFGKKNLHISGASNEALKMATGELVTLLDNDDELSLVALYEAVKVFVENPDVEFVFSDEDKIGTDGKRLEPAEKGGFSMKRLLTTNYVCHLSVFRTDRVRAVGGFRVGYEGAQDYDLIVRYVENLNPIFIRHIPKVLYHWRKIPGSTSMDQNSKPYAHEAGKRVLKDYLTRKNRSGTVETVAPGCYRIDSSD